MVLRPLVGQLEAIDSEAVGLDAVLWDGIANDDDDHREGIGILGWANES